MAPADREDGRRGNGLTARERKELSRSRRENKQLRIEREILSRAEAWFARETDAIPQKESAFVKAHWAFYPGARQCRVLGVSTSGYNAWPQRPIAERAAADLVFKQRITVIHTRSLGTYWAQHAYTRNWSLMAPKSAASAWFSSYGRWA